MQKSITSVDFVFLKNMENAGGFSSEEISHDKEDYIDNYYVVTAEQLRKFTLCLTRKSYRKHL